MRPGLQLIDWGRGFATEGLQPAMFGIRSRAQIPDRHNLAFIDREPVVAVRAKIEAAETVTEPEMVANEAVFIMFIASRPVLLTEII